MSGEQIRKAMADVIQFLAEYPDKGRSTDRPATAVIEKDLQCRVEGPEGWTVVSDMSRAVGGGESAPTPGWLLRAAQASCDATLIAMRAAQEGVDLARLEVTVDSESDDRGMFGIDDAIPAGPLVTRIRIRIAAPGVAPERLRDIITWAEAHSPVADAVSRAIPRTMEIEFG